MRYAAFLFLALITAVGAVMVIENEVGEVSDHKSSLSSEEYQNGALREQDCITRMTPRMTRELAAKNLKLGDPVFIRIFKEERKLELWVKHATTEKFVHFKSWDIAAMSGVLGPKLAEGDRQAPEGFYYVPARMMKPDSMFHLSFNIGFPNSYDRAHDRTGSFIMVHGNEVSIGCFAMTDPSIEEIYTLCRAAQKNGQRFFRVHSFPFRMTSARLSQAHGNKWGKFWANLKEGYDHFEQNKTPPDVKVVGKRYVFE